MVLSYGQTPIPCNKLPSKFLWQQKCLYVAFAYAFSQTWYDWGSTWNGVRLHTDMPSSFRWQLSASRLLCISFHTWHLSACMWPCIYAFFQTCCVRVSTWLNLGGFTRISCDIMPSALRWQLSAIRWHCTSFLSYLVLFGKHLTMLGGILTAGSNLSGEERSWGRDESVRRGAGSQWIVAARPLCHLQCPVAYLSRLQRIQPTARLEGSFEAAGHSTSAGPA